MLQPLPHFTPAAGESLGKNHRRRVHPRLFTVLALITLGSATAQDLPAGEAEPATNLDEPHGTMLERLSSGAIRALDDNGNLIDWSAANPQGSAAVGLDPRVGANIRLGDDPAALPANLRAQAEPHIARSPVDPDFLVATFQEGRFTNGSAVNCGYSVSRDGGLTWTRALIPGLTPSSGGPYPRVTDPVAAIGLNGYAYLNTLAAGSETRVGSILVNRSTDGGATFEQPVEAYRGPTVNDFPDKNWIAVNTFAGTATAGRIVVTFTKFPRPGAPGTTPIMRVYSDDDGVSWTPAAFIHPSTKNTQGSQPVFLPDGKLAVVYWNFNNVATWIDDTLELVVSNDGGTTFGAPSLIQAVNLYDHPQIRDGAFLPSAAADRINGNIYVAYQALLNGTPRILFTRSADFGTTWSNPVAVSDNPAGSGVFNAVVANSHDGQTLTIVFYSNRDNPGSNTLVDVYLAQSFDNGATWQPNIRLTSVSTNAALSPLTPGGHMLGDYIGLAEATNPNVPAVPIWIDSRTGDPDPFVTRVGIAPQVSFTSWQAARLSLGQINNPALGGPSGDADGDGEENLVEFQNGTDPNDPASVLHTGRLLNISTRALVGNGEAVLIGGFIITGSGPKKIILRAIGPSLLRYGITNALEDPMLQLVPASGPSVANDDWGEGDAAAIQASGLQPDDPRESAIVQTLAPGAYTAIVRGKNDTTGVGLVEIFDLEPAAAARLGNISSRGFVGLDDNVLIAGVIVGAGQGTDGYGGVRAALRGIGPSLGARGVVNPLQDPELSLHNSNGDIIAFNDNWSPTDQAELQGTNLVPPDERESAIVVTLPKGNYTAIMRGNGHTTGIGLVEVFELP
ncbi:MAG: exo-alpha-sialidase [Chthoniobacterales bacterium]|nr:exo-alpha-sialidase [Chthoniobacterales bacterium]